MRYVLATVATAGVLITATAATAAKKHPRHVRPLAPAVVVAPAPSWSLGPVRPYGCVQDEGYGRWTVCGQGPP